MRPGAVWREPEHSWFPACSENSGRGRPPLVTIEYPLRGDVKILRLHLILQRMTKYLCSLLRFCSSVTPLLRVRVKGG